MKKIIPIFLIILTLFVTGCGNKKPEEIAEIAEKLGDIKEIKIVRSKRIEDNSIVFILKNKSNYKIEDVLVTIEIWNKAEDDSEEDKLVGSSSKTFSRINAKQSVAGNISFGKKTYDYYKIFIENVPDVKTKNKIDDFNNFLVEDKTILTLPKLCDELEEDSNEKCIKNIEDMPTLSQNFEITIKNKGNIKINYYEFAIVLYKNNDIVGFVSTNGSHLDSKKMRDIKIEFPKNSLRQKIEFDDYTIYPIFIFHNNTI